MQIYLFKKLTDKSAICWLICETNNKAAWRALLGKVGRIGDPPRYVFSRYVLVATSEIKEGILGRGRLMLPGSYLHLCENVH